MSTHNPHLPTLKAQTEQALRRLSDTAGSVCRFRATTLATPVLLQGALHRNLHVADAEVFAGMGGPMLVAVVSNRACPPSLLELVADATVGLTDVTTYTEEEEIGRALGLSARRAVASNPSTPLRTLLRLRLDPTKSVRRAAHANYGNSFAGE